MTMPIQLTNSQKDATKASVEKEHQIEEK